MVNAKILPQIFIAGLLLSGSAFAQTAAPATAKRRLSQNDVAALVLSQSDRSREANLTSELSRAALAQVQTAYDWYLTGESGYERSRFESLSGYGNVEDQILSSSLVLSKNWTTGTKSSVSWLRNSYRSEYSPLSPSFTNQPAEQTQDIFGLTLEQSLWRNFFGYSDRRKVAAAKNDYEAATITRGKNLQDLVLSGLRSFWGAYINQELVKQSTKSIERYERLVGTVRKKSGFGISNPGELAQAEAELEAKKQTLKSDSLNFLRTNDQLVEFLNLPYGLEIDFSTDVEITPPPKLGPVEITNLRAYQSQKKTLESARMKAEAAKSDVHPNIALVGQVYGSGLEENSSDAVGEALSGSRPKYYVGLKLEHNFGSGAREEQALNQRLQAELAEIRLARLQKTIQDDLNNAERDAKVKYAQVESTKQQLVLRERAMNQMNSAYTQGRTDITNVIDAMNKMFDIEVAYSRAIGDYQISLAQWVSLRDELIPDNKGSASAQGGQ